MKRSIPFNLFGESQELCFTISGIAELERSFGKSIYQIRDNQYLGVDFCLKALPICLKKMDYEQKIEEYVFAETGRQVDDISLLIVHAMFASGALGKEASNKAMAIYYPELFKPKDSEQKNV